MPKFQIFLIITLMSCIAFVSCDRAQQMVGPVMPDTDDMPDMTDMTDMPDMPDTDDMPDMPDMPDVSMEETLCRY